MKPPLKAIGYWEEVDKPGALPHPREFVDLGWARAEREKIVAYLRQGVRYRACLGYSYCRFEGGPPDNEMGACDFTDGEWLWPEGLWIYVAKYDVRLPDEFLEHMRGKTFVVGDSRQVECGKTPSREFWLDWWRSWRARKEKEPPR